jgi:hypothetical protein
VFLLPVSSYPFHIVLTMQFPSIPSLPLTSLLLLDLRLPLPDLPAVRGSTLISSATAGAALFPLTTSGERPSSAFLSFLPFRWPRLAFDKRGGARWLFPSSLLHSPHSRRSPCVSLSSFSRSLLSSPFRVRPFFSVPRRLLISRSLPKAHDPPSPPQAVAEDKARQESIYHCLPKIREQVAARKAKRLPSFSLPPLVELTFVDDATFPSTTGSSRRCSSHSSRQAVLPRRRFRG